MKLNTKEDYEGRPIKEVIEYYQNELVRLDTLPENKRWHSGDERTPVIMKNAKEKIRFNINKRIEELIWKKALDFHVQ